MSAFGAIDLSALPAPDVVKPIDYEAVLAALRAYVLSLDDSLAAVLALESEPLNKIIEAIAYREALWRADQNDSARAVMLAHAKGADLDHLAAWYGVERLVIQAADPSADPPVPEVLESDERLRTRTKLAPAAFSVAGSRMSYIFHALTAHPMVKDVHAYAPEVEGEYVGEVRLTILSAEAGDGTPSGELLSAVTAAVTAESVRPLTDRVYVDAPLITSYTIEATLYCYEGPDSAVVMAAAQAAVEAYVAAHHLLGHDIARSGVFAALQQPGVQRVSLTAPASNIAIGDNRAAYCTGVTLTYGGTAL